MKPLLLKAVHPAGLHFEDRHLQNFLDKSRPICNWYESIVFVLFIIIGLNYVISSNDWNLKAGCNPKVWKKPTVSFHIICCPPLFLDERKVIVIYPTKDVWKVTLAGRILFSCYSNLKPLLFWVQNQVWKWGILRHVTCLQLQNAGNRSPRFCWGGGAGSPCWLVCQLLCAPGVPRRSPPLQAL